MGRRRCGRGRGAETRGSLASGFLWSAHLRFPQEEETLSFIRDSLEKSDQLTKNMVSNPSGGRGGQAVFA